MSILQMLNVWKHDFSHPEQAVMLALADHAHEDGTGIRPSVDRIAWKTGYARRNVQLILGRLKKAKILIVTTEATHREPAVMAFNWEAATAKCSFEEFRATKGKASSSRGAKITPPTEVINGSSQGRSMDHPRGDQMNTSGVINRSHEPSIEPSVEPNTPQPPTGECETKPDLANDGNKPELDFLGEEVGANKKQPTGQDIYKAMKFPDVFESWWSWYKAKICSIPEAHGKPKSSPGIKAKAGLDWLKLEESDFKGIGLAEFRLACQLYHKQAFETGGVGVQHGCRFLSGGAAGEPKWLELYQEAHAPATEATPDEFLGDVGESEHLSLSAQIGQQLKRLKISGLLPEAWQTETANFVSELEETGQREYLAHLRQQPDPAPLQFTQRIPEAA